MAVPDTTHAESRQRGRYLTGFPIRCTEAEKQEIFSRAERANRSASRFLVELAVAHAGNAIASPPSREELEVVEGLMVQLRRLASNLQALATREHAAADDDSDAPSAAEIDEAVLEIRGVLDQLRSRLIWVHPSAGEAASSGSAPEPPAPLAATSPTSRVNGP